MFSKLHEEFRMYLKALTEGHPSLIKPCVGHHGGLLDKANQLDDPPSKVRQFFRKISKKASALAPDEKRISDKFRVHQDPVSNMKGAVPPKIADSSVEDSPSVSSTVFSLSGSSGHVSETSEAEASERSVVDEGTLCWNLLVSRLFFDAKNNADIKTSLKARIQVCLHRFDSTSQSVCFFVFCLLLACISSFSLPSFCMKGNPESNVKVVYCILLQFLPFLDA